jgi:hypothetical protein
VTPAVSQLPFVQILNVGLALYKELQKQQGIKIIVVYFGCFVYTLNTEAL